LSDTLMLVDGCPIFFNARVSHAASCAGTSSSWLSSWRALKAQLLPRESSYRLRTSRANRGT
jgi:hypothetical protein